MRPTAIIDTNVVVAGLLTHNRDAPTAVVLDGMLVPGFVYLLSIELLAEYREVLLRPKIRVRHELPEDDVDAVLTRIAENGILREIGQTSGAPDPGDNHLWALLSAQPGCLLVTGDRLLLDNPPAMASVLSPRSFVGLLARDPS